MRKWERTRRSASAATAGSCDPSVALLDRWQDLGDRDALNDLLSIEIEVLMARVRRDGHTLLSASASASDVAQQAVLKMLGAETAPRFPDARSLRAYLWSAAWRLLLDHLRSRRSRLRALEEARNALSNREGHLDLSEADEPAPSLRGFLLNLLPEHEREVLEMTVLDGMSARDAARRLGVAEATVHKRVSRARRRLGERQRCWTELIG